MSESLLSLTGFGVAFGERVILSSVDLAIDERETVVLMGQTGTGKSTLLRTLAGFNDASPSFRQWGEVRYAGTPLGAADRPALVAQSAQLVMASVLQNVVQDLPERRMLSPLKQRSLAARLLEQAGLPELRTRLDEPVVRLPPATQRHLAVMRLAAASPRLLCIDEPTAGLEQGEALRLLDYIAREGRRRAVLVVLNDPQQAHYIGGRTALLAGGVVREAQPADPIFADPESAAGRDVRTGADPDPLDTQAPRPAPVADEARDYVSETSGPGGFRWLEKGRLAGTPRPGMSLDLEDDLDALSRVGITCLIPLTETLPDKEALTVHGLKYFWYPVPHQEAPTLEQAAEICRRLSALLKNGDAVAVHCRTGLGRTGTVLAAYLTWEGRSALSALETVRGVEPRWVESDAQVDFLSRFEVYCATQRRSETDKP